MTDTPEKQKSRPVAVPAAAPSLPTPKADTTHANSIASSMSGRDMNPRMRMMHPVDSIKTLSPKPDSAALKK
jgi:hypothetical protein